MRQAVILVLSLLASGCAAAEPAMKLARSAATFVSTADPALRGLYEAQLEACLAGPAEKARPCVEGVRAKWKPVRDALADVRSAWCEFEPQKCGR